MNPPLDTDLLLLEQFSLVHLLSDTALCAAANLAYLKLEKENLALCDWVDNLQCVICQFNMNILL
jgi:hypothetical protein